jgi:hypothetical protein
MFRRLQTNRRSRKNHDRNRYRRNEFLRGIEQLEPRLVLSGVPLSPAFIQIGLTEMRSDPAFAHIDGSGIGIAILDTGTFSDHPDLTDNWRIGKDFANTTSGYLDRNGHGTHVAGIAASSDSNIGVAYDADIIGLKVFPDEQGAYAKGVNNALEWIAINHASHNIKVINMSLGGGHHTTTPNSPYYLAQQHIFRRLEDLGITIVAAAGNSYLGDKNGDHVMESNSGAPGIFATLNVGAVWEAGETFHYKTHCFEDVIFACDVFPKTDDVTAFSQRPVDRPNVIFAPGGGINSTWNNAFYNTISGTSMASPMVAGVVALMQETAYYYGGRYLSPFEIQEIVVDSGQWINDGDYESTLSHPDQQPFVFTHNWYKRIDAYQAVKEVRKRLAVYYDDPNGTINGSTQLPSLPLQAAATDISERASLVQIGYIGSDGDVTVGDKDVDMFAFSVTQPGTVTLETSSVPDAAGVDSIIRLFDAYGAEIASDDDSGTGLFSKLSIELGSGKYYVGVSGAYNGTYSPILAGSGISGSTGAYRLSVTHISNDINGTLETATQVNLTQRYLGLPGTIGDDHGIAIGGSDVDLYKFTLPMDGDLLIDIDTPYNSNYVDSYMRIFDALENEIFTNDNRLSENRDGGATEYTDNNFPNLVFHDPIDRDLFSGHTNDSFAIGTGLLKGETYYLGISDTGNQQYNPNNTSGRLSGQGGQYKLYFEFFPADLDGIINEANQDVTQFETLYHSSIGLDWNGTEWIDVSSRDVDMHKITASQTGFMEFKVNSYSDASIAEDHKVDTMISVFAEDGRQIGLRDDNHDNFDSVIQFDVNAGVDYFIAVSGYDNSEFDPLQYGSAVEGGLGSYNYTATQFPSADRDIWTDNKLSDRGVLTLSRDESYNGELGYDDFFVLGPDDVDLYKFQPTANFPAIFSAYADTINLSVMTNLRLFDANGLQLATTSYRNGSYSELAFNVVENQTYYIGVNGLSENSNSYNPATGLGSSPGSVGKYTILVEAHNPSPTIDALADIVIAEDESDRVIQLAGITPGLSDTGNIAVYAFAENDSIATANVSYTNGNSNGTLTISLKPDVSGETVIYVGVVDGGLDNDLNTDADNEWTIIDFNLEVTPINDTPTLTPPQDFIWSESGLGQGWATAPQMVTAPDAQLDDQFGTSHAVDGQWAVVGSPHANTNGTSSGAAYVYQMQGEAWVYHSKLTASDVAALDEFGNAVALDGNTIFVGAPNGDIEGTIDIGAVYVFQFNGTSWIESSKLSSNIQTEGQHFGSVIKATDGFLAVGVSETTTRPGSVLIFGNDSQGWRHEETIVSPALDDGYGESLDISGNTMIVGAPRDDNDKGTNAGAAYVYTFDSADWSLRAKVLPTKSSSNLYFGGDVAISGDRAVIGQTGVFTGENPETGDWNDASVFIYEYDNSDWIVDTTYTLNSPYFGDNVEVYDNLVLMGSRADVWLYEHSVDTWEHVIGFSGDYESSTLENNILLLGNPLSDSVAKDAGAVDFHVLKGPSITNVSPGVNESQPIGLTGVSSNVSLISAVNIIHENQDNSAGISFDVVEGAFGEAVISLTIEDGGLDADLASNGDNASSTEQFVISVNRLPAFDLISDVAINEDALPMDINLSDITPGAGEAQVFSLTATSSDTSLIVDPTVTINENGETGVLRISVAEDQFGTAQIQLTIEDGGYDNDLNTTGDNLIYSQTFTVTVNEINDPPTLGSLSDFTISEDAADQTVNLSGITAGGGESQPLRVTATSGSTDLIPNPAVTYTSAESTGSILFTPVADAHGSAVITVNVEDGGLDGDLTTAGDNATATQTFTVTVNPINDIPTVAAIANLVINEDASEQTVFLTGIAAGGDETQPLRVTSSSSISSGQFGTSTNIVVGNAPESVATTDFNGDNKPDLAFANANDNTVSILLGDGNGLFGVPTHFAVGVHPVSLSTADFNGDGIQDLAVANSNSDNVSILLGAGNGLFAAATHYATGNSSRSVAVSDFNIDGKPDLAVTNGGDNTVSILLGDGSGAFGTATHFAGGAGSTSASAADFNSDGKLDLAVVNYASDDVSILLGNGAGSFATATHFAIGDRPQFVSLADFNDDGNVDIVSNSDSNKIIILLGNGSGGFSDASKFLAGDHPTSVSVGDYNADGHLDLAVTHDVSDTVSILLGDGMGSFTAPTYFPVGNTPTSVAGVDLNGDGILDLVVSNQQDDNVSILLGESGIVPAPMVIYTSAESTGSIKFTPIADVHGSSTITVTVEDGGLDGDLNTVGDNLTHSETFTITVTQVNDLPTLTAISDLTIDEDAIEQTVNLSGITAGGGESQPLRVTATSGSTDLIPNPTVTYTSAEEAGFIKFRPVADVHGISLITVTVEDGGLDGNLATTADNGTFSRSFDVVVNPINDAPVVTPIAEQLVEVPRDEWSIELIGLSAGPGEEDQNIAVSVHSTNTQLIPTPIIRNSESVFLDFQPIDVGYGSTAVIVTVEDYGLDGELSTKADNLVETIVFHVNVKLQATTAGLFSPSKAIAGISDITGIETFAFADLNLDGLSDFLYDQPALVDDIPTRHLVIQKQTSPGIFERKLVGTIEQSYTFEIHTIDYDNDRDLDVILVGKDIQIYRNDGEDLVLHQVIPENRTQEHRWESIGLGDLNQDGLIDIFAKSRDEDHFFAIMQNEDHEFTEPEVFLTLHHGYTDNAVGDLDGDGDLDIVATSSGPNYTTRSDEMLAWYEAIDPPHESGAPRISAHSIGDWGHGASSVVVVDLDQDGDLDIVTVRETNDDSQSRLYWQENDGQANFTEHEIDDLTWLGSGSRELIAEDIDGNGKIDLLVHPEGIWYQDEAMVFRPQLFDTEVVRQQVVVGDFDNDYDIDIILVDQTPPLFNSDNPTVLSIYENTPPPTISLSDEILISEDDQYLNNKFWGGSKLEQYPSSRQGEGYPDRVSSLELTGQYLVIGHQSYPHVNFNAGAVFVQEMRDGQWIVSDTLLGDDANGQSFGKVVEVSDNFIFVKSSNPAKIHVYENKQGDWEETARISSPIQSEQDGFGWDIQFNGTELAVADPLSDTCHIYSLNQNGEWALRQSLNSTSVNSNRAFPRFGWSIDMTPERLAISSPVPTEAQEPATVIVFEKNGSGDWVTKHVIASPDTGIGFGRHVRFVNDALLISNPNANNLSGSVYLYELSEEVWINKHVFNPKPSSLDSRLFGIEIVVQDSVFVIGGLNTIQAYNYSNLTVAPTSLEPNTWDMKRKNFGTKLALNQNMVVTKNNAVNHVGLGSHNYDQIFTFENSVNFPLEMISPGSTTNQPTRVEVVSSNTDILLDPTVTYDENTHVGNLEFALVPEALGTVTLTVTVYNGGADANLDTVEDNLSTVETIHVVIEEINDTPTIEGLSDLAVDEDAIEQTVNLAGITAGGGESQPLRVTTASNNTDLIANLPVTYTSNESTGSISFTPVADAHGSAAITVTVEDGGLDGDLDTSEDNATTTQTFTVTVNPVNDVPTLSAISDLVIDEDANEQTISLSGITAGGGESQPLWVTATSDNADLMTNPTVIYTSSAEAGSLKFTTVVDASGSAVITVAVEDGGLDGDLATTEDNLTHFETFSVTVDPVNDLPTLTAISDLTIDEDAIEQTVNLSGITAGGGESQPLRVTATSDNADLIPNPAVTYTSDESTGSITFTPVADAHGSVVITVNVEDGGLDGDLSTSGDNLTHTGTFTVTVNPVNDAPVAIAGDYRVDENTKLTIGVDLGLNLLASDVDDPTLTFHIDSEPTYGNLVLNDNGSFEYTPNTGFNRTDVFTYTAYDGELHSLPQPVSIGIDTAHSFHNSILPTDVNDDGVVATNDAIIVINSINDNGSYLLPESREANQPFIDTDRDGYLAPKDALWIINALNANTQGEGEYFDPSIAFRYPTAALPLKTKLQESQFTTESVDAMFLEIGLSQYNTAKVAKAEISSDLDAVLDEDDDTEELSDLLAELISIGD